MGIEDGALLLGLAMGAMGGMLHAIEVLFNNFTAVESLPAGNSRQDRVHRASFFLLRIAYGASCGFVITFWFMDDYLATAISVSTLAFIQATTGYSGTILTTAIRKSKSLLPD